jgi:hypothetical protein
MPATHFIRRRQMKNEVYESQASFLDVLEKSPNLEQNQGSQTTTQGLVNNFLWPGQMAQIKSKSAGTWIACDNARGIAEGGKVLSHFDCLHPAGVLILQGGMSHEHFTERLNRLTTVTEHAPIKVISPNHFTIDSRPDLCDEVFQDEFATWLSKQDTYRVLILDSVDCFLPEKPEPKKIGRLLAILRRASVTVISIESNGQGGLPIPWNQADLILNVKALDGVEGLIIRISFEKARSLKQDQQKTFFMKLLEREDDKLAFVECPMDDFLKAKTVELLLKKWTQQKIARETGKDQSTISRWITNSIIPDSLLVKDGRKYFLTEAGRKLLQAHGLYSDF